MTARTDKQSLYVSRPPAGMQAAFTVAHAQQALVLEFNPGQATMGKEGQALVFAFDDGSSIRVEGFYEAFTKDAPPTFVLEDNEIDATAFFAGHEDLMPAAGPAAAQGGGRYNDFGENSLMGGNEALDGLDRGEFAPQQTVFGGPQAQDALVAQAGQAFTGGGSGGGLVPSGPQYFVGLERGDTFSAGYEAQATRSARFAFDPMSNLKIMVPYTLSVQQDGAAPAGDIAITLRLDALLDSVNDSYFDSAMLALGANIVNGEYVFTIQVPAGSENYNFELPIMRGDSFTLAIDSVNNASGPLYYEALPGMRGENAVLGNSFVFQNYGDNGEPLVDYDEPEASYGTSGNDTLHGVAVFGLGGNDTLTGSDGTVDNWGTNHLFGGSGNDVLIGGEQATNFLYGGAGNDILVYTLNGHMDGATGTDILVGDFDFNTVLSAQGDPWGNVKGIEVFLKSADPLNLASPDALGTLGITVSDNGSVHVDATTWGSGSVYADDTNYTHFTSGFDDERLELLVLNQQIAQA